MKLVLFVEGHTERKALPDFFKCWLDPRLPERIGIKVVRFEGWRDYYDEIAKKVEPRPVEAALPGKCTRPESVNFDEPPAKLLERLYREKLRKSYKKVIDGASLFQALAPDVAYEKCPHLKQLLDEMLGLAKAASS